MRSLKADKIVWHRRAGRGGFTFVELCLGLAVTALVLTALSAFAMAMSKHWQNSDDSERAEVSLSKAGARLQSIIRRAEAIGAVEPGSLEGNTTPAGMLIWKSDASADSSINGRELLLLQFDPTTRTIYEFQLPDNDPAGNTVWTKSVFQDAKSIGEFQLGLTGKPLIRDIDAVEWQASPENAACRPLVEYLLESRRGTRNERYFATATVRGPTEVTD